MRQYRFGSSGSHNVLLRQPIVRASNLVAIMCLFFAAAFAVLAPASAEQRIGSSLVFGVMPAIALYLVGQFLGRALAISGELCEVVVVRGARCLVSLLKLIAIGLNSLVSRAPLQSLVMMRGLGQKAFYIACSAYQRSKAVAFDLSCLIVRSAALFIIRLQAAVLRCRQSLYRR